MKERESYFPTDEEQSNSEWQQVENEELWSMIDDEEQQSD